MQIFCLYILYIIYIYIQCIQYIYSVYKYNIYVFCLYIVYNCYTVLLLYIDSKSFIFSCTIMVHRFHTKPQYSSSSDHLLCVSGKNLFIWQSCKRAYKECSTLAQVIFVSNKIMIILLRLKWRRKGIRWLWLSDMILSEKLIWILFYM